MDDGLAVGLARARPFDELDRLRAEAHRPAEVLDLLLLRQQVDHRIRRLGIHLGRVGAVEPERRAARTRETATCMPRQMPRYGIPRSRATRQARILPSHPREPKPPGTSTPSTSLERRRPPPRSDMSSASTQRTLTRQPWCTPACFSASCTERYASCSFTYLPTSAISTLAVERADPLGQLEPLAEVGGAGASSPSFSQTSRSSPSRLQRRRDEVDVGHVRARDHRAAVDVGEERDLVADVGGELLVRAADDDVGVDTDAAQLVDRVLRRLRLQLAGRLDERDERHVEVADVLRADLAPELADRLEERQRLDVADGAADLADDDVRRLASRRRRGSAP